VFSLDIPTELKVVIRSMANKSEKGCDPMEPAYVPMRELAACEIEVLDGSP
jgi:hypothetical protein